MTNAADELIVLATITKTQGLKGEFRARPLSGESENLGEIREVTLRLPTGQTQVHKIRNAAARKGFYVLKLAGIDHIDQAESLIGAEICARPEDLEALDEGEFYWYQLVGLRVQTHDGRDLGAVTSLFATGANDVLVVGEGKDEILIPYTDDAIASIDLDAKLIVLADVEGLVE
ncbi:MAG: 16S rRNA processing protein RimM [Deltaproteobacteria bacterium]|nr:16S rRNA processing protein RimM [Deltaproteobacteria bacterium]MCB9479691.1 16S rRNA processing protein RimM [Deltaproteobacteria bacterium]MCB9488022.1 16S rRNA processing protein RimM [Deltaproteobacteria bacterium]